MKGRVGDEKVSEKKKGKAGSEDQEPYAALARGGPEMMQMIPVGVEAAEISSARLEACEKAIRQLQALVCQMEMAKPSDVELGLVRDALLNTLAENFELVLSNGMTVVVEAHPDGIPVNVIYSMGKTTITRENLALSTLERDVVDVFHDMEVAVKETMGIEAKRLQEMFNV